METNEVTVCIPYPFIVRDDLTGVLYAQPNPASAYQWYLDGFPVPNGATQAQIPDVPGTYTVSITDLEGCTSASGSFIVTPVTGLESGGAATVIIFPNPAEDIICIQNPSKEKNIFAVIHDAAGREVLRCQAVGPFGEFDISGLPSGIYTIIVDTQGGPAAWKLVVKR
jgi:hypothetical protein